MVEKVFYVAEDGTKFEYKDKCVYYEKLLRENREVLRHLQGLEDYCQSVDDCRNCVISTLCDRIASSDIKYGGWSKFTDLINKEQRHK